jgi:SnoaL-like domain
VRIRDRHTLCLHTQGLATQTTRATSAMPKRCRCRTQAVGSAAMTSAHQVVAAYWAAAEARDWTRFADLLAEHVVYEAPQTREQVRGRAAYLRFNIEGFPGDWHLAVERVVGEDRHAASWIQFPVRAAPSPDCASSTLTTTGSPGSPTSGPTHTNFPPDAHTWWSVTDRPGCRPPGHMTLPPGHTLPEGRRLPRPPARTKPPSPSHRPMAGRPHPHQYMQNTGVELTRENRR